MIDPGDLLSYFPRREGEAIRNAWPCWISGSTPGSAPVRLALTNQRVLAMQGTNLQGLWSPKPTKWVAIINRDLPDLPHLRHSAVHGEAVTLWIAGKVLDFPAAIAHAAESDIEQGRLRSLSPSLTASPSAKEREVVIREIVKVHCRYCGSPNLQSDKKCSACGATLG